TFRVEPTHDVDVPTRVTPLRRCLQTAGGDVLHRRNVGEALQSLIQGVRSACGLPHRDRNWTFEWLMDQSEAAGCKSAFYFMTTGEYRLEQPFIKKLMRRIVDRDHEIGLHPNLGTSCDFERLQPEVVTLRRALEAVGRPSEPIGGRQHFLSWEAPTTWQLWD